MEKYIRTNDDGERVIDYRLLDVTDFANILRDLEVWADEIELDLDDPTFSDTEKVDACNNAAATALYDLDVYDADGVAVEIERDTRQLLADWLGAALLRKYDLAPEF